MNRPAKTQTPDGSMPTEGELRKRRCGVGEYGNPLAVLPTNSVSCSFPLAPRLRLQDRERRTRIIVAPTHYVERRSQAPHGAIQRTSLMVLATPPCKLGRGLRALGHFLPAALQNAPARVAYVFKRSRIANLLMSMTHFHAGKVSVGVFRHVGKGVRELGQVVRGGSYEFVS